MLKYAVKIGDIQLRSDKPITMEERRRVLKQMAARDNNAILHVGGELEVVLDFDT